MLQTLRRSDTAKAAVILFTLSFILFARVLLRPSLMVAGSDFVQFYFWEQFTRQELAKGTLPLWNPFFFSGYPFAANPQMLLFYPPAMLLRLFPLSYTFGLGMMLHIGWTGLGMYVLARYQKLNFASAIIAAITFMFSGVVITHIKGGHLEWVYTIAWLPWVVWAWAKTLNGSVRDSIIAGVITAMMFLAGAARIAGVAEAMVIVIGLFWLWNVVKNFSWRIFFNAAVRITVGGVVMFCIAAPQLLPSLEFASLSSRAQGLALECATNLSLTFSDFSFFGLARLADQFPEWERNGYVGAVALTLAIVGFAAQRDSRKWLWIVWGAVGIALSVGPLLPFYELARNLIPGLAVIRQPFTFVVMISFALAGLAGLGAERVLELPRKNYALIALLLLFTSFFFDVKFYQSQPRPNDGTFYSWVEWIVSFSSPRYMLTALFLFGLGNWWRGKVGVTVLCAILSNHWC